MSSSTKTRPTVLAVGASGPAAGLVVPELTKRGAKVRALIRDPKKGDAVLQNGAAEIAIGDLTNAASLHAALEGVDSVFYIAPAFLPDEAKVGQDFVAAAKRAGVRRIVFSSVIAPTLGALVNHIAKAPVEAAIIESGMEFCFLQPALFFQGIAASWPTIEKTGAFAQPWSDETRFSWVDYRDVAEVAAIALCEDRLNFGTFELCAQGHPDRRDLATLMSQVLGRPIQATRPPSNSGEAKPPAGLQAMFDWYEHHGLRGNALTLRAILGREPRTLRAYFEELAARSQPDD